METTLTVPQVQEQIRYYISTYESRERFRKASRREESLQEQEQEAAEKSLIYLEPNPYCDNIWSQRDSRLARSRRAFDFLLSAIIEENPRYRLDADQVVSYYETLYLK